MGAYGRVLLPGEQCPQTVFILSSVPGSERLHLLLWCRLLALRALVLVGFIELRKRATCKCKAAQQACGNSQQ